MGPTLTQELLKLRKEKVKAATPAILKSLYTTSIQDLPVTYFPRTTTLK